MYSMLLRIKTVLISNHDLRTFETVNKTAEWRSLQGYFDIRPLYRVVLIVGGHDHSDQVDSSSHWMNTTT